jgi:hypothetical protein
MSQLPNNLTSEEVLDLIFGDPSVKHGLTEFDDLGKAPHLLIKTFPVTISSGVTKGETRYFLSCLKRGENIQVLSQRRAHPEEVVQQLWLYKLHHVYSYPLDHISVQHSVPFGTGIAKKPADIVVFQQDGKTPKIVIEVKSPDRKERGGPICLDRLS